MSMMTKEGYDQWVANPTTPDALLRMALHDRVTTDLPVPEPYASALVELAVNDHPTQEQIEATLQIGIEEFRKLRGEGEDLLLGESGN